MIAVACNYLYTASSDYTDGDLGFYGDSKAAYMKQKHRMLWERRHGPVGTGMKGEAAAASHEE